MNLLWFDRGTHFSKTKRKEKGLDFVGCTLDVRVSYAILCSAFFPVPIISTTLFSREKKYPSFEGNYYALDNLPALKKSPPNNNILEQSLKIETAINISPILFKGLNPFHFHFLGEITSQERTVFLHCPDESYYNSPLTGIFLL